MINKKIIFTVDTESDNQWEIENNQSTENAKFIPRFQTVCESYGVIPVYLVDYSMSNDPFLVKFLKKKMAQNLCEVGCHIHAWDTPPFFTYDKSENGRPYLTEYPIEIMAKKIERITKHLNETFDTFVVSHRAGRWAMNDSYCQILDTFGYKVDCSYTPGISWSKQIGYVQGGSDYSSYDCKPFVLPNTDIIEVPMTISKMHCFRWEKRSSVRTNSIRFLKSILGRNIWLRPALNSRYEMEKLIEYADKKMQYIEFMIHSSELMPGGSPYFKTDEDIDYLYQLLNFIFQFGTKMGFQGVSLNQFQEQYRGHV